MAICPSPPGDVGDPDQEIGDNYQNGKHVVLLADNLDISMTLSTMWIVFSLFMEFTITETFSYFGRLLHMTRDQVDYFHDLAKHLK